MSMGPEVEVVTEFLDAVSHGDADRALALLDKRMTYWNAGSYGMAGMFTKEQFEENFRGGNPRYRRPEFKKHMKINVTGVTAQGERVAIEAQTVGELVDGRTYDQRYHYLFIVRDGKILEFKQYCDTELAAKTFASEDLRR